MKIIRFLSDDGRILYGQYTSEKPEIANIIIGDVFNDCIITPETAYVKSFLSPIMPSNILAIGLNYRRHAEETGATIPEYPVLFMKTTTSVIGHNEPVILPKIGAGSVDYEAELAVVIGKKVKNMSILEVQDCICGYTCANDISARDWQFGMQKGQWVRAKSYDTFCPLGPCLVTKDEIEDPNCLRIRSILNEQYVLQDSNTSDMIFNVFEIISFLSKSMTLLPGTVILTGTPEGVGFTRKPPLFLKAGDQITIDIERIGQLSNPVELE